MPKYMIRGSYSLDGTKGVLQEGGTARARAAEQAIRSLGGKIEAFYFAFGESDVVVIVDLPDNVTAAAGSLAINAAGGISLKTTVLITPQEMDQAAQKTVRYRAPGVRATRGRRRASA